MAKRRQLGGVVTRQRQLLGRQRDAEYHRLGIGNGAGLAIDQRVHYDGTDEQGVRGRCWHCHGVHVLQLDLNGLAGEL